MTDDLTDVTEAFDDVFDPPLLPAHVTELTQDADFWAGIAEQMAKLHTGAAGHWPTLASAEQCAVAPPCDLMHVQDNILRVAAQADHLAAAFRRKAGRVAADVGRSRGSEA